jgi:hypothetical protein
MSRPDKDEQRRLDELLIGLELELMDPAVRRDRDRVLALLAEDFEEFGASGRVWTRDAILDLLAAEDYRPPLIKELKCRLLVDGVALVTYRAVREESMGREVVSLRSSVWSIENGRWRMRFHQGTPAE